MPLNRHGFYMMVHLHIPYPPRWIGWNGPRRWPARYENLLTSHTVDEVRNRIFAAAETIRMEMGNFDGDRQSWLRRAKACIRANGGHFEHLL
jgi:hypothetical protein